MAQWKMRISRGLRTRAIRWLGLQADVIPVGAIDGGDLAFAQHHFPRPKFFLLGYPRSGTTLLARLLRLHPDVHCNWQAQITTGSSDLMSLFARQDWADWLARPSNRWATDASALPLLIRTAADTVMEREAEQAKAHWVGDKTPTARMDRAVDRFALIYPDAWVLAIVRDGRDAALSQRFQAFIDQPETLSLSDLRMRGALENDPSAFGADGRSIFSDIWLTRVAADWLHSTFDGHERAQQVFGDHYLSLRYEDLLAAPWEAMTRLWGALGAGSDDPGLKTAVEGEMNRNPAARWHKEAAPGLVAGLERGVVGGWREWFTPRDRDLFEAVAAEGLRHWRYPLK